MNLLVIIAIALTTFILLWVAEIVLNKSKSKRAQEVEECKKAFYEYLDAIDVLYRKDLSDHEKMNGAWKRRQARIAAFTYPPK